jgi:hypothetical protein
MLNGTSCQSCLYFEPPKAAPDAAPPAGLSTVFTHGTCHRFPKSELKRPDDWCAEHPAVFEKAATITTLDAIAIETRRVAVAVEDLAARDKATKMKGR